MNEAHQYTQGLLALSDNRYYQWILDSAKEFGPPEIQDSLDLRHASRCRNRQCFYNCQREAIQDAGLTYYEGYGVYLIPCHHAWLVDEEWRVLDPTWVRSAGPDQPECYFGMPVDRERISRHWIETGESDAMLMHIFRELHEMKGGSHEASVRR